MTSKHASPEYHRNAKHVRRQVRKTWDQEDCVTCWRCGHIIPEGMPYDVGHIDPFGGEGLENLAPEHRTRTGACPGNRNLGGRAGARITNAGKTRTKPTFQGPPW